MKLSAFSLCLFTCTACAFDTDDFFDRLDTALTISAFQNNLRARLSGTLDLEFYNFEQPPPGLIISDSDNLFNPRLTLFLDTQIGSQIYFFAQSRLDRGFDPTDNGAQVRVDEYALRVTPESIPQRAAGLRKRHAYSGQIGPTVGVRFHLRTLLLRKICVQPSNLGTQLRERHFCFRAAGSIRLRCGNEECVALLASGIVDRYRKRFRASDF